MVLRKLGISLIATVVATELVLQVFARDPSTSPVMWRSAGTAWVGQFARAIAYSPDGERTVIGTDDGEILAFDRNLRRISEVAFDGHRQRITDLCFSPDGGWRAGPDLGVDAAEARLPRGLTAGERAEFAELLGGR